MPEPKRPLKVFLCHAHADRDPVRGLYSRLTQDGVDVWLDKEKLLGGEDWEYEIRNAVRESDIVVVCHSKQFNQKGFRQKEVKIALEEADLLPKGEIFIIPVRLEECDVLDDLKRWHWVDLFEDDGYERLVRALRVRADKIGATLQLKKKWLPIGNTQPAAIKIHSLPTEKANESEKENHEQGLVYKTSSSKHKLNLKRLISVMVQGFLVVMVVTGLILTFWNPIIPKPSFLDSVQVDTTPTFMAQPSETLSVIQTKTDTLPTEITDAKGVSMVLVPSGEFTMASENGGSDELPIHQVYIDEYYMDIYEVTNAAYQRCVDAGKCAPPQNKSSYTRSNYYDNSQFDDYPVIYVDWNMANIYCEWRGGSLPTEAQWEKAARGTDGRNYPWGEGIDCDKANYQSSCVGDTSKVGNYLDGVSPYGAYDMAGNVWEWVNDWYDSSYYLSSPLRNPLGPVSGQYRVLRGGSWGIDEYGARSAHRVVGFPDEISENVGFRCARTLP